MKCLMRYMAMMSLIASPTISTINLAGCWQDGNQIPNMLEGVQKGVTINRVVKLTEFGRLFVKACL